MWTDYDLRVWELIGLVRYFNYKGEYVQTASEVLAFALNSRPPNLEHFWGDHSAEL